MAYQYHVGRNHSRPGHNRAAGISDNPEFLHCLKLGLTLFAPAAQLKLHTASTLPRDLGFIFFPD